MPQDHQKPDEVEKTPSSSSEAPQTDALPPSQTSYEEEEDDTPTERLPAIKKRTSPAAPLASRPPDTPIAPAPTGSTEPTTSTDSTDSTDSTASTEATASTETTPLTALPAKAAVTPRQERILRYLERKRARQRSASTNLSPSNGSGPSSNGHESAKEEVKKAEPPAQNQLTPSSTLPQEVSPRSTALVVLPPTTVRTAASLRRGQHKKLLRSHLVRKRLRQSRVDDRRSSFRFWSTLGSTALALLLILLTITGAGSYAAYRFYNDTQSKYLSNVLTLHDLVPRDNLKMYDSKGLMITQLTDYGLHTSVPLTKVSKHLVNATVATEDKNFWTNPGVDILRILQAAVDNLRTGHVVEGGSTITQQLIKNLVVGNDTSILRKLDEIVLTPQLNSRYSKYDIMEMYLNTIYYGEDAEGIDAAANVYFNLQDLPDKPAAAQLDLAQAAMLAGIPSSPTVYDPLQHPKAALQRFHTVLDLMLTQGYITKAEASDALQEAQDPHFFKQPTFVNRAPHFANFVLSQLKDQFHIKSAKDLSRSDMVVTTTLDLSLQDKIQKIAQQHVAELRDSGHNLSNAAEVLIDFHTGAVISLLGSIDYNNTSIDGQFDVATQGYRQPGSSFKPYVYVTAFEQGASAAQAVSDEPLTISLPGGDPPTYSPKNYDLGYHGHMTIRCALQNSLNIPAVKALQHVGIDNAMRTAKDMGIDSYEGTPGYSLVLGGLGVRLIDHTSAFGAFANGGVHVPYYEVQKVELATTHKTYVHQNNPGTHAISPQLAYMMTSVLSDNQSRIPEFLECNVLQLYSNSQNDCLNGNRGAVRPAAAKTGTTNDFRDNWTVGYTTDYVMGVWAGNDDNSPMNDVSGVQGAAPIWHDSMLEAEQGHPIRDFTNPGGLQWSSATYADGVQTSDWFLPGTVPNAPKAQPGIGLPTPAQPNDTKPEATAHPYCPNNFSFAFPPPGNGKSGAWW